MVRIFVFGKIKLADLGNPEHALTQTIETPSGKFPKIWKLLTTAVILGALAMAAVVYWKGGEQSGAKTFELLRAFDLRFAFLALLIVLIAWCCNGMRLKLLASALGHRIPFWRATQVTLAGEFCIGATPGGTGMVVLRVFLMRRLGVPAGTTLSMMTMDGIMDAIFFLMILPFAFWPVLQGEIDIPRLGPTVLFLMKRCRCHDRNTMGPRPASKFL